MTKDIQQQIKHHSNLTLEDIHGKATCGTNKVFKIRSFPYRPAKKLEGGYKVYGSSIRNNKEAV